MILCLVSIDLAATNRRGRVLPFKQALFSTGVWIALAFSFAGVVHWWLGSVKSLEFVTGYLIEEAFSVDNLFVFILLFKYFKVPAEQERTVLFWGILGALIMRGAFILSGLALIRRFHWIFYALGALLVYSGFQLMRRRDDHKIDPSRNLVLRLVRRFLPVSQNYVGNSFVTMEGGRRLFTPLLAVLLVVETTDILFATDSIPAILAISRDSFVVYTSNVFAILGLRSLFFALAGLMKRLRYLNFGLAVVSMFVGVKMLLSAKYEISTWVALLVIAAVLTLSVVISVMNPKSATDE